MAITVSNLNKSYGSLRVLEDVNVEIDSGEFVSIVGPSGCGKSTFLSIIAELVDYNSGQINFDGMGRSSFVFQSPRLLDWRTVEDNLRLVLKPTDIPESEYDEIITDNLEKMNLGDIRDSYPRELSGGMKSRVSLIRGLIVPANLILMDEPLGAIDELTARQIRDELLDLWNEKGTERTVLYVTHDVFEAVYLSDRILVMGRKPTNFIDEIVIDIPRPRDPEDSRIFELQNTVYDSLPE